MADIAYLPSVEQDQRYMHLLPELDAVFEANYDNDLLRYHIWQHGLSTFETNNTYRNELRLRRVPGVPGLFMTHIDSKGHDFGLRKFYELEAHGNNPYTCPEELAIVEVSDILRSLGVDEITIAEFSQNVLGTKVGVRCKRLGMFTLCAADMSNTGEDYETVMKLDTEKLRQEKENLTHKIVDPVQFNIGSLAVISRYRFENLWIPKFLKLSPAIQEMYDKQGMNLQRMAFDTAAMVGEVGQDAVEAFLKRLGGSVAKLCPLSRQNPAA